MSERIRTALEVALDEYFDHFGENYPLSITGSIGDEEELIRTIRKCIEDDQPAPEPSYRDGCDY